MSSSFPVTYSTLSAAAIATKILPDYDLGRVEECRLIHRGLNDTYLVGTGKGEKYILRVYRASWRSLEDISYELDVLLHLQGKRMPVCAPLRRQDGDYLYEIDASEGKRYAALFDHAPGRQLPWRRQPRGMQFQFGRGVAKIYNAMQDFTTRHQRFRLDLHHLIDGPLKAIRPRMAHRVEDTLYLERLAEKIRDALTRLPLTALEQGFCHGDLYASNAHLADDGTLIFFDFDCCGCGWRAYDLASFRWAARVQKKERARWKPFLAGYRKERQLNEIDVEAVPIFVGVRNLWIMGLHAENTLDWGIGWMNEAYFDRALDFFRDWDAEYLSSTALQRTFVGAAFRRLKRRLT